MISFLSISFSVSRYNIVLIILTPNHGYVEKRLTINLFNDMFPNHFMVTILRLSIILPIESS